ncbi:MAG: hypothetical protein ACE5JR_06010 [Gemmatimonadota bacterium]
MKRRSCGGDSRPAAARRSVPFGALPAARWSVLLGATLASACIGGQILRGYPGYPFQTFATPAPPDSVFLELQGLLGDAGYPLDYTRRETGLINTRRSDDIAEPLFLSVVVGPDTASEGSRVWVTGFVETLTGPRRVNPKDVDLWAEVAAVSERLSSALHGTAPTGPEPPEAP